MPELTLTLYSSSFCGACRSTRRQLDRVEQLLPGRVRIREINVADDPERAEAAAVTSTPTVLIEDGAGQEISRAHGVPTVDQVLSAVARALP